MMGSKFFDLNDPSLKSYTRLIEYLDPANPEYIKDNEVRSLAFSMEKKSVLVGFSKGGNSFKNSQGGKPKRVFTKPLSGNGCEDGMACICLCKGYEWKDNQVKCEDMLICNSIAGIDIVNQKPATAGKSKIPATAGKSEIASNCW